MRKKLIILILPFILSGCMMIQDSDRNYDTLISNIISSNSTLTNTQMLGYKYYLPVGVRQVKKDDFNEELSIKGTRAYLYVDLISYYYQKQDNYEIPLEGNYYSQKFEYQDKKGSISLNKEANDEIYLEIIYNYAKIELYTKEDNLTDMVLKSMVILSSMEYNDIAIENLMNSSYFASKEEIYNIENPEGSESTFLESLEENAQEENIEPLPDEKNINNELAE